MGTDSRCGEPGRLSGVGFSPGHCFAEDVFIARSAIWFVTDGEVPPPGDTFYYVARNENQVNVTTWGTPTRDTEINAADGACAVRFP